MKRTILLIITLFAVTTLKAQNNCNVTYAEAYYFSVLPGVNPTIMRIDGVVEPNKIATYTNISIYLFTSCMQTPVISFSTIGKMKITLEFVRLDANKDEVGNDEQGHLKIIKAPKGTFLWKANWSIKNETTFSEKQKIMIKGIIGKKKFTTDILSLKKSAALPMY